MIEPRQFPSEIVERRKQPAESTAVAQRSVDGLSIRIAPLGVAAADERASPRLIGFAALFSTVVTLMSAGWACLTWAGQLHRLHDDEGRPASGLGVVLVMSAFWLIGVAMWLAVVHRGRRGAGLSVSDGALSIEQTGLFGRRLRRWRREELADIRVAQKCYEDDESGDRWLIDLRVYPCVGRPYKLLAYRPQAELEWIATTLRDELQLPPAAERAG